MTRNVQTKADRGQGRGEVNRPEAFREIVAPKEREKGTKLHLEK